LLEGTLDLIILKALSTGPLHGLGAEWNRIALAMSRALEA
jgi:hypothetical protein